MATNLDLQEQEQLDALKAFWKSYGNLITWTLILALGAFAGWRYWQHRQAQQGLEAGAMYEELDRAATANDLTKTARVLADLQQRFPKTTWAAQGALLTAKLQAEQGQADAAKASLGWVAEKAGEEEYRAITRLRLAGLLLDAKDHAGALKVLDGITAKDFAGLAADRRGDVLFAQGKADEARAAYQAAYKAMDEKIDYRRLVEVKLTALAAPPAPAASGAAK